MQTFLPYASYAQSAEVLDTRRLGKQRVEVYQIMRALGGDSKGWSNHPATKMWSGYETALTLYGVAICDAWIAHGFKDTCTGKILATAEHHGWLTPSMEAHVGQTLALDGNRYGFLQLIAELNDERVEYPHWTHDMAFHVSHQSNLVRKDPAHYRRFFRVVPDCIPYVWPVGRDEHETTTATLMGALD